jgi:hypothetical protein
MSWKQWVAIVLVIGFGIVWQIRGHDVGMDEHAHEAMTASQAAASGEPAGPYRILDLEVTGMT